MWTTPDSVRVMIGLDETEAPDPEILPHIYRAQRDMLNDIALFVRDDLAIGDINGANTTFTTNYRFYADNNFDNLTNTLDIEVYAWGIDGSIDTRSTVALSLVNPTYGFFVTSTPIADTVEAVRATYFHYPKDLDTRLIGEVCTVLAGYYYVMAEWLLIPDNLSHGAYRFRLVDRPYKVLWDEYNAQRERLLSSVHAKGEHDEDFEPDREVLP